MRLELFVKLKKWLGTIILSVGIKYSLRDVLCLTYKHTVNDVTASGISLSLQVVNSIHKPSFRWRFILKFLCFPYFFWFSTWFCHIHLFYPCRCFKHSNWWRHKWQIRSHIEYSIQPYSMLVPHFILKIDEKCSRTGGLSNGAFW